MNIGYQNRSGMTLLEVVMVLMLIGILATVVINRYPASAANVITQTAVLKAHLRYAQLRSMNTNTIWGINFDNNTYWLFNLENMNIPILLPGETTAQLPVGSHHGISIVLTGTVTSSNFYIVFDSLGRPGINLSDGKFLSSSEDLFISISDESIGNAQTVTVTANTGFIP